MRWQRRKSAQPRSQHDAGKNNHGSVPALSRGRVSAPRIGEAATFRAEVYRLDRADHDEMRHDLFCFHKPAVESGGGAPQYRTARAELRPLALSESLTETMTRAASKNIRKRLM